MRHPPMAIGWIDRPHQRFELGDMPLESGEVLREAFLSYVIHGDPSRLPDHAILANTAIGSTHHRLDFLIGEGAALDTGRWCVIVIDALGNGLSSSPSNSGTQAGAQFPRLSIRDMVESQRRLIDHLGVNQLVAVVGASMGAMQAVQWAVSHPERMANLIAMVPMARAARWSQLVNEMSRRALFTDLPCHHPRARDQAMPLWAALTQLVMPRSPEALEDFPSQAALMSWLHERERQLAAHGPDPFDWCRQTWAYDGHDVGGTPGFNGDTNAALRHISAAALVLAPASDLYNPVFAAQAMCESIARAQFVLLPGHEGHASAGGGAVAPTAVLQAAIGEFLSSHAR
jgi:homoserine O-acetyltransferase